MTPSLFSPARPDSLRGRAAAFYRRHRTVIWATLVWSLAMHWWEGEYMWSSHSPAFEPVRIMGVLDAWRHGIWDARWLPLFDEGYGYPIFSFHSPLFSWVGAAILAVTGKPVLALKLAVMIFFVIGGLGCRTMASSYWARPGTRDREAGDLAFLGWAGASYLFTNIFVRGSLAEYAASCFVPWLLWGMWLISSEGRRYTAGGFVIAVSLALTVLSHNAVALYAIMLVLLPLPVLFRPAGWRGWAAWAAGVGFAGCMSAFFAVAATLEKGFVRLENVAFSIADVRAHFLRPDHLLSLGAWSQGLSGQDEGSTMPRHQGLLLPLVLLAAVLAYRMFRAEPLRRKTAVMLALAGVTLLMAMGPSMPLWEHIRTLQYTQFPWRWLSLNATALALLVPALGLALRLHGSELMRQAYVMGAVAVMLLNVGLYGGPGPSWSRWQFDANPEGVRAGKSRTALSDEYGPIWRGTEFSHAVPAGAAMAENVFVGPAKTSESPWAWTVAARAQSVPVVVGVHYFPGWKAYWRPKGGAGAVELPVENEKSSGLIRVSLAAGPEGRLELKFTNTPVRFWLKVFSAVSLVVFLVATVLAGRRELAWREKLRAAADEAGRGRAARRPNAGG